MNGVVSGHKTRLPTFPRPVTFRECQGGGQLRNPNVCSKNTPFSLRHCGNDCRYETSWALVSGNWAPCGLLLRTEKKEEERSKKSWRSCMRSETEEAGPAWYPSASSRIGNTLEHPGTPGECPRGHSERDLEAWAERSAQTQPSLQAHQGPSTPQTSLSSPLYCVVITQDS